MYLRVISLVNSRKIIIIGIRMLSYNKLKVICKNSATFEQKKREHAKSQLRHFSGPLFNNECNLLQSKHPFLLEKVFLVNFPFCLIFTLQSFFSLQHTGPPVCTPLPPPPPPLTDLNLSTKILPGWCEQGKVKSLFIFYYTKVRFFDFHL